jgi:hypothetical protein
MNRYKNDPEINEMITMLG